LRTCKMWLRREVCDITQCTLNCRLDLMSQVLLCWRLLFSLCISSIFLPSTLVC
jgi:hypothetical protein